MIVKYKFVRGLQVFPPSLRADAADRGLRFMRAGKYIFIV